MVCKPEVEAWMGDHAVSALVVPGLRIGLVREDLEAVDPFLRRCG